MKRITYRLLIAGLVLTGLPAIVAVQCSGSGDGALKDAIIWRISGDDLQGPSYLFGTVHLLDSSDFYLHKTVIEQLKRADAVVFETNPRLPGYQEKALENAMMANDSLKGVLSAEQYETIRKFFLEEFNFPVEAVKQMKPFYLASLIGALQAHDNSLSYEQELIRLAQKEGKTIKGISTIEKESGMLSLVSLEEQVAYLFDEIESYRNGHSRALKEKMMEAYRAAAIETIDSLVYRSLAAFGSIYEIMFPRRNESWVPGMIELMQKESCFFAVGAGHLPGESGLIRLLRKKGYKVVPVHMDFWFHD
jgi:uncharacterized protein